MKKKKTIKRICSGILTAALLICTSMIPAKAETVTQPEITDTDVFISEEAAEYIAEFFIRDMAESGTTIWNADTAVTEIVPMYDETGENVVSYTAELTDGYLVISAYADAPSLIMEWADEAAPVYEELPLNEDSKIIHTGTLAYFADNGGATVVSAEGAEVPRAELSCQLMDQRSPENVPVALAEAIEERNRLSASLEQGISPQDNGAIGDYISDPYVYAQNVYGGTWKCKDYANYWENYTSSARVSLFENYKGVHYYNHCGPVAITNILKMYGKKYGNSSLINKSYGEIFEKVIAASKTASPNYYINSSKGGTKGATANKFIEASFRQFGIAPGTKIKTFGSYEVTYENIVNATTADRLMYIMLWEYGSGEVPHDVVGYAYTNIYNTKTNKARAFIKICDGYVVTPRYIDASQLDTGYGSTPYWEVKFYN